MRLIVDDGQFKPAKTYTGEWCLCIEMRLYNTMGCRRHAVGQDTEALNLVHCAAAAAPALAGSRRESCSGHEELQLSPANEQGSLRSVNVWRAPIRPTASESISPSP